MLPIDVAFDTGEKTERGWKQEKREKKNIVKDNYCSKVKYSRGKVGVDIFWHHTLVKNSRT